MNFFLQDANSDVTMSGEDIAKIFFNTHWQLSSSLTTQHLISIVAVCNTLMSMNYARLNKKGEPKIFIAISTWVLSVFCLMLYVGSKGTNFRGTQISEY